MHRKARISNPTFKTSPQYMQQERRTILRSSIMPLLAPQRPQERFRHALWLRVYGSVDKAVYALAVGFCVGSEQMARSTSRARNRVNKFVKPLFRVLLFSDAVENVITQDCI